MHRQEKSGDPWVAAQREWHNPSNWRGGILGLYYAPADPRIVVRKQWHPGGWTFNFARRASWFWLGAILLSAAAVIAWEASRSLGS